MNHEFNLTGINPGTDISILPLIMQVSLLYAIVEVDEIKDPRIIEQLLLCPKTKAKLTTNKHALFMKFIQLEPKNAY